MKGDYDPFIYELPRGVYAQHPRDEEQLIRECEESRLATLRGEGPPPVRIKLEK